MSNPPTILVFDSGLGGLTVLREIVAARPDAHYVYVADDAFFPYGHHTEAAIVARVVPLVGELISHHAPDLVTIACNTASTLVMSHLREQYEVPFVGTVPAIKPACASSKTKRVSVLGTKGTVKREYTRKLIDDFSQGCEVTLVGSPELASLAESALSGNEVRDADIAAELAPCFVEDAQARTDTVVLACTHYPLLMDRFVRLAPWPVAWIDPAPAIARRVLDLMGPPGSIADEAGAEMIFTSKRPHALSQALMPFFGGRVPASPASFGSREATALEFQLPPEKQPLNRLKKLWREGRPTFGAIATIPSIQTVQIMAQSLDWIIVDLEHGPIDLSSAHAMIVATSGTPCVPMVRIAANEPWLAKAPMDIGALGINFPMICSRADAEKAVRSVRYPPRGERLWGPFHAPFRWGVSMADYMATSDDDMICIVTIEHVEAVNRIDEIMATPGIDLAVIGPGDLATSINKRGLLDDPEVVELMARAEAGILKSGVPIGGVARTPDVANKMIERGYVALALGFDWSLFQRGIAASLEGIKR